MKQQVVKRALLGITMIKSYGFDSYWVIKVAFGTLNCKLNKAFQSQNLKYYCNYIMYIKM